MGILKSFKEKNNYSLFFSLIISLQFFGCDNTSKYSTTLLVDTLESKIDYLKCIEESKPTSGFILNEDSVFFLSYISEDSSLLKIKSVFTKDYNYSLPIKDILKLNEDDEIILGYDNQTFYIFLVDSSYYYSLGFTDIKNNNLRPEKHTPEFLKKFMDNAYFSTGSSLPIVVFDSSIIIPYRLRKAKNENLIDTTAYCVIRNFKESKATINYVGQFPKYGFDHYDVLIRHVYTLDKVTKKFYFTNRKSDRITVYDVNSDIMKVMKIPNIHNVRYKKDLENSSIDYTREYMTNNDINFALFCDTSENVYLIRKQPCPENEKRYQIICFSKFGTPIASTIIKSNTFNVPLSFIFEDKIYIPNGADDTYFVVSLELQKEHQKSVH